MKNLTKYLKENRITFKQLSDNTILLDGKEFELIKTDEDGLLFDDNFTLINDKTDKDGYVYQFGSKWYYMYKGDEEKPKLNPLKYIGKTKQAIETNSFLGVRGSFELLNGSRLYKDWCKKAKFLGCSTLGICEKNTLAGVLKFQIECDANGIKPIIGETVTVLRTKDDFRYDIKVYAKNEKGWANLLLLNKELNVINYKFVREERFLQLTEGLFIVIDPKSLDFDKIFPLDLNLPIYYQLDPVEYENNDRDKDYLLNLKKYVRSDFKPISITDAFYLDKEDSYIKPILNSIGKFSENKSTNQHFKSKEEYFYELDQLFNPDDESFEKLFSKAVANEERLVNSCNFKIELGKRHLPKYKMTEEEKEKYTDNEDMFWALIEEGFKKKVPKGKEKEYLDRVKTEVEVIKYGEVMDYFLILWDIIKWSRRQGILTGIARGSAGGSLISFLLNVTEIDPLRFGLLFERFLNVGRAKVSLPDVDCDFCGERREEVKHYMEQRFGINQVCSIGTYTTFQMKAAIKDLSKQQNVDFGEVNYVTTVLDLEKSKMEELFENAAKKKRIKNFVQANGDIINTIPLVVGQPKSQSIHACATLILPDDKDIFAWIPVKKMTLNDGQEMLVSEWEGGELEQIGMLKEDILGIKQLDKFYYMLNSINRVENKSINIYTLPLDDDKVYTYFKKGWCGDVFHFGSSGLTNYCKELKPDDVNDLIAGISLYRPGAMENNFHNEYILRKNGERESEPLWGLNNVTNETYHLIVYQEQVMQACVAVGGFTLVEADDIRKAMGKKKKEILDKYKDQFLAGALNKGCPEVEAIDLWDKLEKFAGYSFNKCISGKEKIHRGMGAKNPKAKSSFHPTIEQMYNLMNSSAYALETGKQPLRHKYRRYGYGTAWSLNRDNKLVKNKIKDIRFEGERDVYKMTLKNGASIVVTDNHKFPTSNGEKLLKDINIESDLIFVNDGHKKEDTGYRFTDKGKPNNHYHSNDFVTGYTLNSEKGKMGFQKRETPYTMKLDYINNKKKDFCEICGVKNCRLEVHHCDNNHANNDHSNLKTVCVSCHKKEHYKMGRVKMGEKGLETKLIEIESITYEGKENVYDVEMEAPNHTFTNSEGIVTCNSHAAAYAITGYVCQWLKVHYPIHYWTTAFRFGSEDDISNYISEINKTGSIKIMPPDINSSFTSVYTDFDKKTIYWALSAIKNCGETSTNQIIEEREKNGQFFTLEEFIERHIMKGSKVNKRVLENLILSGAFDEIEDITNPVERLRLINQYRKRLKGKQDEEKDIFANEPNLNQNWWWILQQKRLSGVAFFDYKDLCNSKLDTEYIGTDEFFKDYSLKTKCSIGGYVTELVIRESKKGKFAKLTIESNYVFTNVLIWSEQFDKFEKLIEGCEKSIVLVSGTISFDKHNKTNQLQSNEYTEFLVLK